MDLSAFVDVNTKDPASVGRFMDYNMLAHQTTCNALRSAGFAVSQYPLFGSQIDQHWIQLHFTEHLSWANALGLSLPPDLGVVDMADPNQAAYWLENHYLAHMQVNLALGL